MQFNSLTPVTAIRRNGAKALGLPATAGGVYKWWCLGGQLKDFLTQLQQIDSAVSLDDRYVESTQYEGKTYYCFYVGMTKGKKGLAGRIKGNHIGKYGKTTQGRAIRASTLRKSINALKNGMEIFDENYVDDVLNECLVQWVALPADEIDERERKEINAYIRILNTKDCLPLTDEEQQTQRDRIAKALRWVRNERNKE